jgi:hypothetical protein
MAVECLFAATGGEPPGGGPAFFVDGAGGGPMIVAFFVFAKARRPGPENIEGVIAGNGPADAMGIRIQAFCKDGRR